MTYTAKYTVRYQDGFAHERVETVERAAGRPSVESLIQRQAKVLGWVIVSPIKVEVAR